MMTLPSNLLRSGLRLMASFLVTASSLPAAENASIGNDRIARQVSWNSDHLTTRTIANRLGHSQVEISSGDELVDIDVQPGMQQVRRSNSYAIEAAMKTLGWNAELHHLPDDKDKMVSAMKKIAAMLGDTKVFAEHCLGRCRSEANDYLRLDDQNLRMKPRLASFDLTHGWLFVESPFASRFPPKMLYSVGHIDVVARDPRLLEPPPRERNESRGKPRGRDGAPPQGVVRYRLEVGHAHGVQPGNIVGAIANEAGIDSAHIGRIGIFDEHSTVDLPEGMPPDIYEHLRNTWVCGRKLAISLEGGDAQPLPARHAAARPPARKPKKPKKAHRTRP